jgi:hypothetical protein
MVYRFLQDALCHSLCCLIENRTSFLHFVHGLLQGIDA